MEQLKCAVIHHNLLGIVTELAFKCTLQQQKLAQNKCIRKLECKWTEWNVASTGWVKKNWTCLSVDNSAMVARRKACDMSKVLECCKQEGPNLHSKSFKYLLPNLHKSSLPLKLGICLHSHVPKLIELKNSLPKSRDLNSVNCSVWGHCKRWHGHKISVTDELKRVLIEC